MHFEFCKMLLGKILTYWCLSRKIDRNPDNDTIHSKEPNLA